MEQKQSAKALEVMSAVVFAIASVAIAWCAYQSAWWGSIQLFRAVEAMGKTREASVKTITAQQQRLVDVGMFMQYLNAVYQDNTKLADFYQKRFRPEMKVAVEAWLATNPLENPKAPLHPFVMPEYSQAAEAEAQQLADQAEKILGKAREANRILINYVFLTVLLASTLSLGGMAGRFQLGRVKIFMLIVAMGIFLTAMAFLVTYPVAK
jgi:hypothetical protein